MKRRCVRELTYGKPIWHIVPTGHVPDDDFAEILCGLADDTGIALPSPVETVEPTCPECRTLAARRSAK